jgi:hypothetical protein
MNGLTMDAFRSGKISKGTSAFTVFMFTFVFYLSPNGKAVADELTKEDARQAKIEKILENLPLTKLRYLFNHFAAPILVWSAAQYQFQWSYYRCRRCNFSWGCQR